MKNILVPTDFSENCNKAAELGIRIAKLYDAEIHFFHLLKTPVDWVKLDKLKEKRYPETLKKIGTAKASLRALEKKAEKENLKCLTFLQFHVDHENILKHSGHYGHDFIVTGSSGTKGIVRELLGSNVERLVSRSDVPVMVVKEDAVRFPFQDIVFVSDFVEDVSNAFKEVLSIAEKCNAKIHLLRINTESDRNSIALGLDPIRRFLEGFPKLKNFSMNVYNEMMVETGINTYLQHNEGDLITMCTHGHTGFLSLFSKSIAEGLANHASLPVMTMKI